MRVARGRGAGGRVSASHVPCSSPESSNSAGLPGLQTINCPFQRDLCVCVWPPPPMRTRETCPSRGSAQGRKLPIGLFLCFGKSVGKWKREVRLILHPPLPGANSTCCRRGWPCLRPASLSRTSSGPIHEAPGSAPLWVSHLRSHHQTHLLWNETTVISLKEAPLDA